MRRACAAIANATTSSYTVAKDDAGHSLLAIVQATNGSTIQNAFSTATPPVVPHAGHGPLPTVEPDGQRRCDRGAADQRAGRDLAGCRPDRVRLSAGTAATAAGANCTAIPGATQNVYTLGAKDTGRTIGLR